LLAGVQTDPNANYSRVAKVEGVFFPDPTNADGKKLQYLTSTYKHQHLVLHYGTQSHATEEDYAKNQVFCSGEFGPNKCHGMEGMFGADFTNADDKKDGLWRLWLWLPEQRFEDKFDYNLQNHDKVIAWVGEFNSTAVAEPESTGYW
jgi:hypothetical protein